MKLTGIGEGTIENVLIAMVNTPPSMRVDKYLKIFSIFRNQKN